MDIPIVIKAVETTDEFAAAQDLIRQYVNWLDMDLTFQNFEKKIESLPVTYGPPNGRLFLAFQNGKAVGVTGIKRLNETDCELKKMFVLPNSRGQNIGQQLLDECIDAARDMDYKVIKLDTAEFMKTAIRLYQENGFKEIDPYQAYLHGKARFFEFDVSKSTVM